MPSVAKSVPERAEVLARNRGNVIEELDDHLEADNPCVCVGGGGV